MSQTLLHETVWDSWSCKDAFNGPKLDDFISFFEKKLSLTLVALSQWYQGYLQQGYPVPQDSPGQDAGLPREQGGWLFEQVTLGDDGDDNSNNSVQTPPIKYFL